MTVSITHATVTGAIADPDALVDGPAWDAEHVVTGLTVGTDVQAYDAQLSSLIRQNSQSADYTTVLTDGGKHLYHPSTDNNGRTWTIDGNTGVEYPIGTPITFVNEVSTITITINFDTLILAGTGAVASVALAAYGVATALKVDTTKWIISGTGLS